MIASIYQWQFIANNLTTRLRFEQDKSWLQKHKFTERSLLSLIIIIIKKDKMEFNPLPIIWEMIYDSMSGVSLIVIWYELSKK